MLFMTALVGALYDCMCLIIAIPIYAALGAIVFVVAYWTCKAIDGATDKHRRKRPRHNGRRSY